MLMSYMMGWSRRAKILRWGKVITSIAMND